MVEETTPHWPPGWEALVLICHPSLLGPTPELTFRNGPPLPISHPPCAQGCYLATLRAAPWRVFPGPVRIELPGLLWWSSG